MIKKIALTFGAFGLLSVAGVAFAQTASTTNTGTVQSTVTTPTQSHPMILEVGPAGRILMRGTIASISSGVLTVNGWGGTWTINVGSGTRVLPMAASNDLTKFNTGDFVGIEGTVSQTAGFTVDATLVRDWTYRAAVTQEQKQNIQSARGIRNSSPRDYIGTASNVNGTSFTITAANGTSYTVNVASNAEVVNRNWLTLPLSSINSGDHVRVYGVNASGTITAQIVRDVTIPTPAGQ